MATTGCQRCGDPDLLQQLADWRMSYAPDLDTIDHEVIRFIEATRLTSAPSVPSHGHRDATGPQRAA